MINNILLTGSGCPGWFSVFKSLREWNPGVNIFSCDIREDTAGAKLSSYHFTINKGDHPSFISDIDSITKKHSIDLIIPLTDPELIPLSEYSSANTYTKFSVLVSEKSSLEILLNKSLLYKTFPEISPNTKPIILDELNNICEKETWYLKSIKGYGSRGTKKLVSVDEWVSSFDSKKPDSFGSIFPYEHLQKLPQSTLDSSLLVEYLPGKEYSIDCVFDSQSNLRYYVVRERVTTNNGISSCSKLILDTSQEFFSVISTIAEKLPMKYNINIQVKRDKEGHLKLLEVNPRVSGSISSFASVGIDLVKMTMNYLSTPSSHRVSFFI